MSPKLRVSLDPESLEAASVEAAGWLSLESEGAVTEAEAKEIIREIAHDVKVSIELKL